VAVVDLKLAVLELDLDEGVAVGELDQEFLSGDLGGAAVARLRRGGCRA
jgi:hypothetical protein